MQGAWIWSLVRELDPTCCKQEFICCNADWRSCILKKKKKISSRFLLCFFEYFLGAHPYMSPVLPAACNALLFKWQLYQEVWRYTFGKRAYCHKSLNWGLQWKAQQGKFSYFPLETLQLVSISKAFFFFFSGHRGKTIALSILVLLLNL